jgi:hypothetical protein
MREEWEFDRGELRRAMLESTLVVFVFLGWWAGLPTASPIYAVEAAMLHIGLISANGLRASPDQRPRRVAAGLWLLPGLAIAAACALVVSSAPLVRTMSLWEPLDGVVRMMLAGPPVIAWLVGAAVGVVIPAAGERALELRARRWRIASVLGGLVLTGLLAGIVLRDARRAGVAEIGGSLETVAPLGWKLLGAAALVVWLALVLVGVISAPTQDSRSQRDGNPDISPYRHAKPASPGGRSDPRSRSMRYRCALLAALLGSAPLAASAWVGAETLAPRFSSAVTAAAAVIPTEPPREGGVGVLSIDASAAGSECILDGVDIGPAPRWGMPVRVGDHHLRIIGQRELPFSLAAGETLVIRSER